MQKPTFTTYKSSELSESKWKLRKMAFTYFASNPFYSISFPIDLTKFQVYVKEAQIPLYPAMLYIISKTINQIEQFRYRIQNNKIVCYEQIDVGITLLLQSTEIKFRRLSLRQTFQEFVKEYEQIKKKSELEEQQISLGEDVFYTSCLPWIPFTGFHCQRSHQDFCIPTVLWGKIVNNAVTVSVQVNHRTVDGYHLGQFYEKLQKQFDNSKQLLSAFT